MNDAAGTTRLERRRQRLDDPRFEGLRTPGSRRRLAGTLIGLLVVETIALLLLERWPVPAVIVLALVLLAFVLCLGALKATTRGIEELPREALDERQWQVRGESYARAYRIGFAPLSAELALVAAWLVADLPAPGAGSVLVALLLPVHVGLVLPTIVAALSART